MRLYKLFYVGDVESSDDYNEAREEFEAARVGEINEDGTIGFELELVDVQQYPAGSIEAVRRIDPEVSSAPAIEAAIVPRATVPHPWDEGAWIFPEDHPLAAVEKIAFNLRHSDEREDMKDQLTQISLPAPQMIEP